MRIGIIGAGHIGLYLGARLMEAGAEIVFLGRGRMQEHLASHGLKIRSYLGQNFEAKSFSYVLAPAELGPIDYAINTLKTTQTREVFQELKPYLSKQTKIVNLQNGVETKNLFEGLELEGRLFEGMVTFNVVINEQGEFYQSSSGPVAIDATAGELIGLCQNLKIEFLSSQNIHGVKWSKLLLNLNNALNALAGIPIKAELENRSYRRILATLMREALVIAKAKGIKLEKLTPVRPEIIPFILELPNPVFKIIARQMISIDPKAKSSMLMDLENKSRTEIDYLNFKVYELGASLGLAAPYNEKLSSLIRQAEISNEGSPKMSAEVLMRLLTSSP